MTPMGASNTAKTPQRLPPLVEVAAEHAEPVALPDDMNASSTDEQATQFTLYRRVAVAEVVAEHERRVGDDGHKFRLLQERQQRRTNFQLPCTPKFVEQTTTAHRSQMLDNTPYRTPPRSPDTALLSPVVCFGIHHRTHSLTPIENRWKLCNVCARRAVFAKDLTRCDSEQCDDLNL